jgi:L-iditol 2-dehydrogenase
MTLNSNIKSSVFNGPGDLKLIQRSMPKILPGTVLIKVEACAICGSDLRIYKEGNSRIQHPRVLGHEIAGTIVDIGQGVDNFSIGDNVAVGADVPCGKCKHCISGRPNCCDINYAIGYQFDGGFSQYILLDPLVVKFGPISKFSKSLSFEEACLAEPLACCINGYERGLARENGVVVIIGGGPIGIMLALLAPFYKMKKVILIEPSEFRLSFAMNIESINHYINPNEVDPIKEVHRLTDCQGADLVFTANPVVETHEQAISMLAKRGVVNFFGGLPKDSRQINFLSNIIHYKEAYITGSHGSTPSQHQQALHLIEKKEIEIDKLITNRFSLDDLLSAFKVAGSGKSMKTIIKPHV